MQFLFQVLWICSFALCAPAFALHGKSLELNRNRGYTYVSKPSQSSDFNGFSNHAGIKHNVVKLRGGSLSNTASASSVGVLKTVLETLLASPTSMFNGLLIALVSSAGAWKLYETKKNANDEDKEVKPAGVKLLQMKFLGVFWLMRMADWLQGPYFYEVYSSKILNGSPVSLDLVSKLFLVGFASTGIFGPFIGRLVDTVGRKAGTIAYALLYSIGALSTRSNSLPVLLGGRLSGGLGTSLLHSAPESWLVSEHQKQGFDGKWLGQTFGWAYAGDSLVAIAAGQLANMAVARDGPTGPFSLSVVFLLVGSIAALFNWDENRGGVAADSSSNEQGSKPSIKDAMAVIWKDKRILQLGAVQALFEGAMYIFVLQWAPAMKAAIQASATFGPGADVPYGSIFSCFMASCLVGSTAFGVMQARKVSVERIATGMLALAFAAMSSATMVGSASLPVLVGAFFLFEACVGMYFPSIGTLRSKYIPSEQRSIIMNLFGIPLNLIVVSVFLSIRQLGVAGALTCASGALALACASMAALASRKEEN
jgi:MFS family permease